MNDEWVIVADRADRVVLVIVRAGFKSAADAALVRAELDLAWPDDVHYLMTRQQATDMLAAAPTPRLTWQRVASSNVQAVGFAPTSTDGATGRLEVRFANGGHYRYDNVPTALVDELRAAPSVGTFFATAIRNGPYNWTKLGAEAASPELLRVLAEPS